LCINLVIEASLYYGARSEKHQIMYEYRISKLLTVNICRLLMKNTKRDTEKISPLWIYFKEFMYGIYHKRKSSFFLGGGVYWKGWLQWKQKIPRIFGRIYRTRCFYQSHFSFVAGGLGVVLSALPFRGVKGADRVLWKEMFQKLKKKEVSDRENY
jgi:hypothetical protein